MDAAFLSRFASGYVMALRSNLENSEGNGRPLDPLFIWDSLEFKSRDGSGMEGADRTNSDRPLIDSGRLLDSIKVASNGIEMVPPDASERAKRQYTITFSAEEYGMKFTEDGVYRDVPLGKTIDSRISRDFASLEEGVDFVVKKRLRVSARPWNRLTEERIKSIAAMSARS